MKTEKKKNYDLIFNNRDGIIETDRLFSALVDNFSGCFFGILSFLLFLLRQSLDPQIIFIVAKEMRRIKSAFEWNTVKKNLILWNI